MDPWTYEDNDIAVLDLISAFLLLYSVMRLKNVIKNSMFGFPNKNLVTMHWVCELTWTTLFITKAILNKYIDDLNKDNPSDKSDIETLKIEFISNIVYIFMQTSFMFLNCFLLYLIGKFVKGSKPIMTKDPILDRDVPNFVFL